MKYHIQLYLVFSLIWLFTGNIDATNTIPSRWIIQTSQPEQISAMCNEISDWELKSIFKSLDLYRLSYHGQGSAKEVQDQLKMITNLRATKFFYHDSPVEFRATNPNDPFFLQQWNMSLIDLPLAWDITTGGQTKTGEEIVVAVLDDGFDLSHPDITENIWFNNAETPGDGIDNDGNDYVDDHAGVNLGTGNDDHPVDAHGLNVCGIIGAKGNNDQAISGVNWDIKMMLISGIDFESDIIEGYDYILEMRQRYNSTGGAEGAFIVATNLSAGIDRAFAEDYPLWCQVYDQLGQAGILNVAATTNKNIDVDVEGDMPTTCLSDYLLSVTNVNEDDEKVANAGYGLTHIDLGAPGTSSLTTHLGNTTRNFPGTSAAAPHVTGVVALMYSAACEGFISKVKSDPGAAVLDLRGMILNNVDENSSLFNKSVTGGRLNAFQSILGLAEVCGGSSGDFNIVKVWPNPAKNGRLVVQFETPDNEEIQFKVVDILGRIVYEESVSDPLFSLKQIKVETNGLPMGIYFATIQRGDEIKSAKFLAR
jgi:subtilisin family serine protease